MITGPQTTGDEIGDLNELAGVYAALAATSADICWTDVTRLLRMTGWERCPRATADVDIAGALLIPIVDLTL